MKKTEKKATHISQCEFLSLDDDSEEKKKKKPLNVMKAKTKTNIPSIMSVAFPIESTFE